MIRARWYRNGVSARDDGAPTIDDGTPTIDLNSDLGEGLPAEIDDAMLALVSSANVACGGHAGDDTTMRRTLAEASVRGVRVGAHPSYPDRANFGRVTVDMDPAALEASIVEQIGVLARAATERDTAVSYVKPHGALYNDAAWDERVAAIVVAAARASSLPLMTLAGSPLAGRDDVRVIREGFLDRAYRPDGSLVPRSEPGALLTDPDAVVEQALRLAPAVDSLSLHSDTPGAVGLLSAAREALIAAGYTIAAR